jgi:D-3-phosphoglycerate dehydrogenase
MTSKGEKNRPIISVPDDEPPVLAGTHVEEHLRRIGDVHIWDDRPVDADALVERIRDADVVVNIRSTCLFTSEVLERCPKLKIVSIYGIGVDNVDLDAASRLGIAVCNTPGYSSAAVAELALGLMLAVGRRIVTNDRNIRGGGWATGYGTQLHGKTLGVVGTGAIGQQMIRVGKSIGMKVLAWTLHPSPERAQEYGVEFVPLDGLLSQSDVVSLHLVLSPETTGLIGERELSLMKSNAILVNTARGPMVDEKALVQALREGRIGGAGLDVFELEPLPPGHPLIEMDNVVLSPHTAAMTPETTLGGLDMAVDNVENFLAGNPSNVVNPSSLDRR